jgi:hypothetical protein
MLADREVVDRFGRDLGIAGLQRTFYKAFIVSAGVVDVIRLKIGSEALGRHICKSVTSHL